MTISSLTKEYIYSWDSNQLTWVSLNKTQGGQDIPQTGGGETTEVKLRSPAFQTTGYHVQSWLQTPAPASCCVTPRTSTHTSPPPTHPHTPSTGRTVDYLHSPRVSFLYSPYYSCNYLINVDFFDHWIPRVQHSTWHIVSSKIPAGWMKGLAIA